MKAIMAALVAETRKGILIMWSYKFNLIVSMVTLSFVFLGINFMLGNGQINSSVMASTLLAT